MFLFKTLHLSLSRSPPNWCTCAMSGQSVDFFKVLGTVEHFSNGGGGGGGLASDLKWRTEETLL